MSATEVSREWPYLRVAFLVVGALIAAQLVGWGVYSIVHEEPAPLPLIENCLRREKLLEITSVGRDPIALDASGGALATRVEGNGVHVLVGRNEQEMLDAAADYRQVSVDNLDGRLEVRGRVLYLWEGVASPTQRQTMYDCWYG